jgi:hypothetical protein
VSLMSSVRQLLARRARGGLSSSEEAQLLRDARTLRRRLDRFRARHPEIEIELSAELDELAPPPVLTASG